MRSALNRIPTSFACARYIQGAAGLLFVMACLSAGCAFFDTGPAVSPGLRKDIVSIALQYKGTPYRWQGSTASGFDCSGFVRFVFRKAGIEIPRTSKRQYNAGDAVDRSDLKRGDLVFFARWV